MRIISGSARSRRLVGPPGQTTRPMTDRVREALFSSILAWIPDGVVLDLYAGTGSMGLEALSRGAAAATFVERDRAALAALRSNLETVGLGGQVVADDVDRYLLRAKGPIDVAFVDPPYAVALPSLVETMTKLSPLLAHDGIAIVHRRSGEDPPESIAGLVLADERRYGSAVLWRYAKEKT
ncbi:MAG: 16S rRNA (guanine(966)-N(2))-methyltransferase RsmD [bacterium]|nr:16S rRNA (guanine(966)-N(2))-methyltransferase RsmD [bacterium]MCP4964875.1 16S rRNA (guanine(966)-N(2))-methyltransferase RsmD [bacterium]